MDVILFPCLCYHFPAGSLGWTNSTEGANTGSHKGSYKKGPLEFSDPSCSSQAGLKAGAICLGHCLGNCCTFSWLESSQPFWALEPVLNHALYLGPSSLSSPFRQQHQHLLHPISCQILLGKGLTGSMDTQTSFTQETRLKTLPLLALLFSRLNESRFLNSKALVAYPLRSFHLVHTSLALGSEEMCEEWEILAFSSRSPLKEV